ncbi:MAG: 50S ribosomal protein L21 [Alphaproteobacteria bacterium]|nr:50S ribosomal protein L21 [Alphaproteobacteria bacterium]MBL0718131.1 50S ribosomal protein L21 [Alphaproteobacteria bacterium]
MFAVVKTGGSQFIVRKNDIIEVNKLSQDSGEITLDQVLLVDGKVGTPLVKGATVIAEIVKQKKDDKVLVFKKKRRQGYKRLQGFRAQLTVLKIKDIKSA